MILLTIDIDTRDHHPFMQSPYTLPLKHNQWVTEGLEISEEAEIIS